MSCEVINPTAALTDLGRHIACEITTCAPTSALTWRVGRACNDGHGWPPKRQLACEHIVRLLPLSVWLRRPISTSVTCLDAWTLR